MNIKRIQTCIIGLSAILLIATAWAFTKKSKEKIAVNEDRPNVIIILTDDQGYADVGFNGCKDIPTPNIDRIAKDGVVFTNGYVSYAVCAPSQPVGRPDASNPRAEVLAEVEKLRR